MASRTFIRVALNSTRPVEVEADTVGLAVAVR